MSDDALKYGMGADAEAYQRSRDNFWYDAALNLAARERGVVIERANWNLVIDEATKANHKIPRDLDEAVQARLGVERAIARQRLAGWFR